MRISSLILAKVARERAGLQSTAREMPDSDWLFYEIVRVRTSPASLVSSIARVGVRCDSRLESNAMIGPRRFRRCQRAYALCPFRVLVIWVLI